MKEVGIAIVGCGNIAAFYFSTLARHPILRICGVMDRNPSRSAAYSAYYCVPKYDSLEQLLADPAVELVINVTNPRSHYAVSKASLEAGKHIYSEKPLATSFPEAVELVQLAAQRGLSIASAPSRILAETAQTLWRALREDVIGKVHAIYAEMDGGLIYRAKYKEWKNEVGMHWPYKDEFEVGCTIEHAGYPVSWLTAYFGPVESVTAFATCQIPELEAEAGLETTPPPDLTVACLKFKSGPVARLTSSWIAPSDHSIRVFGDTGVLSTGDVWMPRSPVYITRDRSVRFGPKTLAFPWRTKYPFAEPPTEGRSAGLSLRLPKAVARALRARFLHLRKRVDFCLGPAELAASIRERRQCRLSPEYCLHNTEIVMAIHNAIESRAYYKLTTSFPPMEPLPWAAPRVHQPEGAAGKLLVGSRSRRIAMGDMNSTVPSFARPVVVGGSVSPHDGLILVTGSNGFIGVKVVQMLLEYGCRNLRCFVRPTSRVEDLKAVLKKHAAGKAVEIVTGDLKSAGDCVSTARGVSLVFHLAAGFEKSFASALTNSALATRNLLEAFVGHGQPGRFVHVSSFSVYSNFYLERGAPLDETSPMEDAPEQRADPYAMGKLKQEEAVREFGRMRNLPFVVVRPGAVFGPGKRDLTGRVGLKLGRCFFHVGGSNQLPLTYVDNCAEAIVLAGLKPDVEGETFNVVDDELPTSSELLVAYRGRVRGLVCLPVPYAAAYWAFASLELAARILPGLPRRFNRRRAAAEWKGNRFSNWKVKERLGWRPRVPMREGVEVFLSQYDREPAQTN